MIEIKFTCDKCHAVEFIQEDDVEEKNIVPLCENCYKIFEIRRRSLMHSIKFLYAQYNIDIDTFRVE